MSIKSYVPGTEARRNRLFRQILRKKASGADGLAIVEWEDGSESIKPVKWDGDNSAIVDEDGNRWFARGLGSEPNDLAGVPVWHVFAGNAGIMSTESALLADAEEYQDRVYDLAAGDELPDDLIAEGLVDPNTGRTPSDVWDAEPIDSETVATARDLAEGRLEAITPLERNRLERQANAAAQDAESDESGGVIESVGDTVGTLSGDGNDDESVESADDIVSEDDHSASGAFDALSVDEDADSVDETDDKGHDLETDGGVAPGARAATSTGSSRASTVPDPGDLGDGAAVYDLRPPDGYDGVAISVRQPDYYDPNPVTRSDAKAAVEWSQRAEQEGVDRWMVGFIVGLLVFGGIWLLMTVIPWLLGEIGGGSGGGGGQAVTGLLFLFAAPGSPVRSRVEDVVDDVVETITTPVGRWF